MDFNPALVEKLRERAARFEELTEQLGDPELIADGKRYPKVLRERGSLEKSADMYAQVQQLIALRKESEEIVAAAEDDELVELAHAELEGLEEQERKLDEEIKLALISDPDDARTKVIFEIRAGAGGDEASLFAADLFRMYGRYFETKRWKIEVLEESHTEVGGYKELVFAVDGDGAWRQLRFESGGHRVQRVPTTESQGRIHTSAATVAVLPEAEDADVDLNDNDLRIDTMRSSGPGGQSVNKTSSAVRITHLPTDTVVICQDEKSQHKNKAKALRILRSRLFEAEQRRLHEERSAARKSMVGSGDRSARVRTYNFPQNRVTDHRLEDTDKKNFSLEQIIEGRLESLIEALEGKDRQDRLENL
ncbi:MAG: peptide chain release factor 1 [bacterium]|nr:peptide chain release factor 1 [bacterium]